MAYKKYIEKNGKIYGPYIYHSKRVDGKVVSEYHGVKKEKKVSPKIPKEVKSRRTLVFGAGILIVLAFVFWTIFFQTQFTGRVILDIEGAGVEENLTSGNINLLMRSGELIPANTIVKIENGNLSYEYFLSDLVDQEKISDSFYLEGSEIVGEGEGYGIIGKKEELMPVFFQFELVEEEIPVSSGGGDSSEEETQGEIPEEILEEIPVEEETQEEVVEEVVDETQEEVAEEITGEVVEEIVQEEILEETPVEEETQEGSIEETVEEVQEGPQEEIVEEEPESTSEPESPLVEEPSPGITGNIIGGIGGLFRGSFTGRVIDENLIQGDVTKGEEFRYNLPSGKKAKIIEQSVRTEEGDLNLEVLEVNIVQEELVVTTDYSKIEEGFGEEYLGEEEKFLSIPLTELGIVFVPGPISVTATYGEIEIFSVEGEVSSELIEIIKEELVNESINETNITLENATEIINVTLNETPVIEEIELSEEEKEILKEFFKMIIVQTEARNYRDKILVEFSLGDYTLEHYYDENLTEEELKESIEEDRIIWLKDLARELSKELESSEEILDLKEIYPVL